MTQPVDPTNNRSIRVFVSSTFRDMQEERDYLVKYTFPQLRKLCEMRGVVWGDVDLRWGITDEAQAEGQVLPFCLEEIHRCRPYFIGLLGERYGWVPEQIPDDLIERQPWLKEHRAQSITELEIQHGVLRQEAMHGQAFFYFRDSSYLDRLPTGASRSDFESESPEAQAKLISLKDRLRDAHAEGLCTVREPYPDPKALGQWILDDFTALINEQFPEGSQPDPLDREALDHQAFAQSCAKVYIGRSAYFERLDSHVEGKDQPLVVLGESGSGKSALLANWFLRYQQADPDTLSLIHFIGATPYSADWAAMLRRILSEFKRRFDIREEIPTDSNALRSTFANWLHRAAAKGRVLLIFDALNQLEDREGASDLVWLPPVIPANVRLIVSTLPGRALDNLTKREWPTLTVHPLHDAERRTLITQYLAQYTKSLSPPRINTIATAPQTANPLYLRILLDELRVHGSHETLEPTITHYLEAETIPDLYGKVLARWERDYEGETDLVGDALSFLWAARRGLSETEWRELLGTDGQPLPQVTFTPFLLAAELGLVNRAGLFTFVHDYLREAVREAYVPTTNHQQATHRKLAEYFAGQPLTIRQVDERPWQLAEAAEWQQLARLLGEEQFFVRAWEASGYEVRRTWARVEQESPERMTETYRAVGQQVEERRQIVFAHYVANLLQATSHLTEAEKIYHSLQGRCRQAGDQSGLSRSLGNQAKILQTRGDLDGAMRLLKEQEQLCQAVWDWKGLITSKGNQAVIMRTRGDLDGALRLQKLNEQVCREVGYMEGLPTSLGSQALILQLRGDLDGAMQLHKEEETLCRELGDLDGLQRSLGGQGLILRARGDLDGAMRTHKVKEQLCRELGDAEGLSISLGDQAEILRVRGNLDGAMQLLEEQEHLCRKRGDTFGLVCSLGDQAEILQNRGDLDGAMRLLKEKERLCRELGDQDRLQALWGLQGVILYLQRDLDGAMQLFREQERLCRELGNLVGLQAALGDQAVILKERGDLDRAMQLFREQERLCRERGHLAGLQASLGNQAVILLAGGDLDGAMQLLREQERLCRELGDANGLAFSWVNRGEALAKQGKTAEGRQLAQDAFHLAMQHGFRVTAQQILPIVQRLGGKVE